MNIHPNEIVRLKDGPKYYGLSPTQIDAKIKTGEIPAPIPLSASGRAKGWLGHQIIDHQRRLLATAR
jgi:predicted DNA-binding transcriptional regulator AlpA